MSDEMKQIQARHAQHIHVGGVCILCSQLHPCQVVLADQLAAERQARQAAEHQRDAAVAALRNIVNILGPTACDCEGQQEEVNLALREARAALAGEGRSDEATEGPVVEPPRLPPHASFPVEFMVTEIRQGTPRAYQSDFEATEGPGVLAAEGSDE